MPFGLPITKEDRIRRYSSEDGIGQLERRLIEYKDILDSYKRCLTDYRYQLDRYDKRYEEKKLTDVQTALDMTYLKEQGGRTVDLLSELQSNSKNKSSADLTILTEIISETGNKIDGLDKNVVDRLSEFLLELQRQGIYQNKQIEEELTAKIDKLGHRVKKENRMLLISLLINLVGVFGLGIFILFSMI